MCLYRVNYQVSVYSFSQIFIQKYELVALEDS